LLGALIAIFATALVLGQGVGLRGVLATLFGLLVLYLAGRWVFWRTRRRLHAEAFSWHGSANEADPIRDFRVRPWSGWPSQNTPPPYVRRTAMAAVEDGLNDERFVLLLGERTSGKSRLLYELASKRAGKPPGQMVLVAAPLQASRRDPFTRLMDDPVGLARAEEPQLILLRDFVSRLIDRRITGDSVRSWLERYPTVSVVATISPDELEHLKTAGEEVEVTYGELTQIAKLVTLDHQLDKEELTRARSRLSELDDEQLRDLPRHMVLEHPLRERLDQLAERDRPARMLVGIVVDWRRAGLARPAPRRFLHAAVTPQAGLTPSEFDAALAGATEPVHGAARLVDPVPLAGGEIGFEPNRVVVDLIDGGPDPRPIPDSTWEAIYEEVIREVGVGKSQESGGGESDEIVAEELIALGEAALARGKDQLGRDALKGASAIGGTGQQRRSAQAMSSGTRIGSVIQLLVDSRRGDGVAKRIRESQSLAAERRALNDDPTETDSPHWLPAAIYRRRVLRACLRAITLIASDVASAVLGLAVGMVARALFTGEGDAAGLSHALLAALAPWAAATVFVFGLARLYRQDAPRARLGPILFAASALGVIGYVGALAAELRPLASLAATALGVFVGAFADYRLRVIYDSVSRDWVKRHTLSARTLLIGRVEQVAALAAALPNGITRPTKVCGYLTYDSEPPVSSDDGPPLPKEPWLASIEQLAQVVASKAPGRVLICDDQMSPARRQALADRCHLRGLLVEAVPSIPDIQAGSAEFIAGQSVILIPLIPLWRGNTQLVVKRCFDFALALLLLVLLLPVLALVALAIWIRDGRPLVVRSWRPGVGKEVFSMYRFRTAPESRRPPDTGVDPGTEDQPTELGARLRNHGLDELPQLLNVLLGDMSLVGPRPLRLAEAANLHGSELLRYVVRPGATSPFQVCGRSSVTYAELTAMDLAYLRQWSLFTDLDLLAKTARLVLRGRRGTTAPEPTEPGETASKGDRPDRPSTSQEST
jgi:lipopolysaccharide/colanic/teichoic acid biosynthesis glycosyltransferase